MRRTSFARGPCYYLNCHTGGNASCESEGAGIPIRTSRPKGPSSRFRFRCNSPLSMQWFVHPESAAIDCRKGSTSPRFALHSLQWVSRGERSSFDLVTFSGESGSVERRGRKVPFTVQVPRKTGPPYRFELCYNFGSTSHHPPPRTLVRNHDLQIDLSKDVALHIGCCPSHGWSVDRK